MRFCLVILIHNHITEVTFSSLPQTHVRDLEFFSSSDSSFADPLPFPFALKQRVASKLFNRMASQINRGHLATCDMRFNNSTQPSTLGLRSQHQDGSD
jgi:hypothetical protein